MKTSVSILSSLRMRLLFLFLLYAVIGSAVILTVFYRLNRHASIQRFLDQTRHNATFIESTRLPMTERMARYLGDVQGAQAFFVDNAALWTPVLPAELQPWRAQLADLSINAHAVSPDGTWEAAKAHITEERDLVVVRSAPRWQNLLFSPDTLLSLGLFWLAAVVLTGLYGRYLVTPLKALSRYLPTIYEQDSDPRIPGIRRRDEIGELARTFLDTHHRLLEEREGREQAERMAVLTRMAASFAHEIQNPLAAARMHLQLLAGGVPEDCRSEVSNTLATVGQELNRVEGLINQWLYLVRPEPPSRSECSLSDMLRSLATNWQARAEHAEVTISVNAQETVCLNADAKRLRHVLDNLVLNAIQAMPRGGAVNLECRREEKGVVVEITDQGDGFSAEALSRACEMFFSTREGGMGIGLNVCDEIVRAHGGRMVLENHESGGRVRLEILETEDVI